MKVKYIYNSWVQDRTIASQLIHLVGEFSPIPLICFSLITIFKIKVMDFVDKLNLNFDETKINAAKELANRDCRYKDILSIIVNYCNKASFINNKDVSDRTDKYKWLCFVVDIHLIAIMLTDQIDGNDIPMDSEMIKEDNEAKAKQILESIVLKLVSSSPKPNLGSY
ncbi:hypothetical protein HWA77_06300 [Photobacterium damselae subsp. damselae]|uniref:Uncharacterized protein n=1 Tax=Photobacterium damselae subsp. damselae TaxID=85581 RepID=A0A850QXX7_PHODD|nr:hypothetical protein [Photobacterium damselae subsp. damselae]